MLRQRPNEQCECDWAWFVWRRFLEEPKISFSSYCSGFRPSLVFIYATNPNTVISNIIPTKSMLFVVFVIRSKYDPKKQIIALNKFLLIAFTAYI